MAPETDRVRDAGGRGHPLISIVVPCYNESETVSHFYRSVTAILDAMQDVRFEVVVVDDGSRDDTVARLITVAQHDRRFRIVELSRNFGKEAALTAAIDHARGDAIIPIDFDLQDPPELIPRLIAEWRRGADVVLPRRVDRRSDSFFKRTTARLFYRLHNQVSAIKIPENVGDFRLLDRTAVAALARLPERQRFMKGLFAWIGFKPVLIDYVRPPRVAGHSKYSGWMMWNLAIEGITSFSAAPLKIWTYVGAVGACLTFGYAAYIVIRTLIHGVVVPGYASLLVAVLFLGSLQLIGIGILGEYIGRIYMESKQRPTYLVRGQTNAAEHEFTGNPAQVNAAAKRRRAAAHFSSGPQALRYGKEERRG
jgi:polyisoprenyl-phosphate glycosyltransferase